MNTRKVIQICAQETYVRGGWYTTIFALCDDGTVWIHPSCSDQDGKHEDGWQQIENIPCDTQLTPFSKV